MAYLSTTGKQVGMAKKSVKVACRSVDSVEHFCRFHTLPSFWSSVNLSHDREETVIREDKRGTLVDEHSSIQPPPLDSIFLSARALSLSKRSLGPGTALSPSHFHPLGCYRSSGLHHIELCNQVPTSFASLPPLPASVSFPQFSDCHHYDVRSKTQRRHRWPWPHGRPTCSPFLQSHAPRELDSCVISREEGTCVGEPQSRRSPNIRVL